MTAEPWHRHAYDCIAVCRHCGAAVELPDVDLPESLPDARDEAEVLVHLQDEAEQAAYESHRERLALVRDEDR